MVVLERFEPPTRQLLAEYCYAESVVPWHGVGDQRMLRALAQASESLRPVPPKDVAELQQRLTGRSAEHHASLTKWTDSWLRRGSSIDLLALASSLSA